jgi:membrane protein required for colicin V production
MRSLAVADIVFAVLILILMIRCALRGFISAMLSWASVALGLLMAFLLYKNGAAFLRERFFGNLQVAPEALAFIVLFLIVFVAVQILETILKDIIQRISLGGVDRVLGLIFGFFEGLLLVSLILFLLVIQPLFPPEAALGNSFFARLLLPLIAAPGSFEASGLPLRGPDV